MMEQSPAPGEPDQSREDLPGNFAELAASRRAWIEETLIPWCRQAARIDLLQADEEWLDIAGKVAADATLWTWAWSRFSALVHERLPGVNETYPVCVTLRDGREVEGYPDSRRSKQGRLVLLCHDPSDNAYKEQGPFTIDEIADVRRAEA